MCLYVHFCVISIIPSVRLRAVISQAKHNPAKLSQPFCFKKVKAHLTCQVCTYSWWFHHDLDLINDHLCKDGSPHHQQRQNAKARISVSSLFVIHSADRSASLSAVCRNSCCACSSVCRITFCVYAAGVYRFKLIDDILCSFDCVFQHLYLTAKRSTAKDIAVQRANISIAMQHCSEYKRYIEE